MRRYLLKTQPTASVAGEYIRHTTVKGGWLMFITEHGTLDYNSRDIRFDD